MTPQEFRKAVQDEIQTAINNGQIKTVVASKLSDNEKAELKTLFDSVVNTKMHALAADVLDLNNQIRAIKDALSTGKGLQKNINQLSQDEYKRLAPARIEAASLAEVVELTENK